MARGLTRIVIYIDRVEDAREMLAGEGVVAVRVNGYALAGKISSSRFVEGGVEFFVEPPREHAEVEALDPTRLVRLPVGDV